MRARSKSHMRPPALECGLAPFGAVARPDYISRADRRPGPGSSMLIRSARSPRMPLHHADWEGADALIIRLVRSSPALTGRSKMIGWDGQKAHQKSPN